MGGRSAPFRRGLQDHVERYSSFLPNASNRKSWMKRNWWPEMGTSPWAAFFFFFFFRSLIIHKALLCFGFGFGFGFGFFFFFFLSYFSRGKNPI